MACEANIDIDIVEDDDMVRELFVAFAKNTNFTTNSYNSAEHYLDYVTSNNYTPPNITIVTDVRMPGKSGYELMSEIRKINPLQKFVVVTGTPNEGYTNDELACFYLAKPVSINRIQTVFNKLASCADDYSKCTLEEPLCKTLSDLDDFYIKNWRCPRAVATKLT